MKLTSTLCLVFLFPSLSFAQIYQCDGKWTNKPCGENNTQKAAEKKSSSPDSDSQAISSEKRSAFHELTMKSIQAKREFEVNYDLRNVESFCFSSTTSLEECQERIEEAEDRIDHKIASQELIKKNKLQKEANALQKEKNRIETSKTEITIIENKYYRRRHRRWPPNHPQHPHHPRPHPHAGGSSISVSAQGGSVGGGKVSVGGSFGASSINYSGKTKTVQSIGTTHTTVTYE